MDPLSVSASAAALVAILVQSVRLIKTAIETIKKAANELGKLLNRTERFRLLLEQLRSLTHQLGNRNNSLLLLFNDSECHETTRKLSALVGQVAKSNSLIGLRYLLLQNRAEELVVKLQTHEEEIQTVLLSVATFVYL